MRPSLRQLLYAVASYDVIAFVVAWSARHAKHGVGLVIGDIAWYSLLAGVLLLVALAVAAGVQALRVHRTRRPAAR